MGSILYPFPVFLFQVGSEVIGRPQNVTVTCLNLNYTLLWDPPINKSPETTLYYTVFYFESWPARWLVVSSCVNITENTCNLAKEFNSYKDIYLDLQVSVFAHDNAGNSGLPANTTFNPLTDATVGAPRVVLDRVTAHDVSVAITAPLSPFDNKLVTEFLTETAIKYNISIWKSTGQQQTKIREKFVASSVDYVYFGDLLPDTLYRLIVQTSYDTIYGTKYSPEVATSSFQTKQKKPSYGPDVSLGSISKPDCLQLNLRNVTINWKVPPEKFQNGKITKCAVVWREKSSLITTNHTVKDASQTSFTLVNLSRWHAYEVSVIAYNNAGGTRSAWLTIAPHTLDRRLSQPQDFRVESNKDSVLLSWQPPRLFPECIMGYSLIYQWDTSEGKETRQVAVYNATSYQMTDMKPSMYTFLVAPYIYNGYNNITSGIAASTVYPLTGNSGGNLISWPPVFIGVLTIVIVISAALCSCMWKSNKFKSALGLHKFDLDRDNKILKFARSYKPAGIPGNRVEPEYFDATTSAEHAEGHRQPIPSDESQHNNRMPGKLNVGHGQQESQELPVVTPDVGFSCFHFPEFPRRMLGRDEHNRQAETLSRYNPSDSQKKHNEYGKVEKAAKSGQFLSASENDLYIQSEKLRVEMPTESCHLLPESAKRTNEVNAVGNLDPYCKMSQLPALRMRKIQYARLNSYSESDISGGHGNVISNDVETSESETEDSFNSTFSDQQLTINSSVSPVAVQNNYDVFHDSLDMAKQEDTELSNLLRQPEDLKCSEQRKRAVPKFNRADSYPYSQLAVDANKDDNYIRSDFVNKDCSATAMVDKHDGNTLEQPRNLSIDIAKSYNSDVERDKHLTQSGLSPDLTSNQSSNSTELARDIRSGPPDQSSRRPSCAPVTETINMIECDAQGFSANQLPKIPSLPECEKGDELEPYILISEL